MQLIFRVGFKMGKMKLFGILLSLSLPLEVLLAGERQDTTESYLLFPASTLSRAERTQALKQLHDRLQSLGLSLESVFADAEKSHLRELGAPHLAETSRIRKVSRTQAEELQHFLHSQLPKMIFEREGSWKIQEEPWEKEQWGLKNLGRTKREILDVFRSVPVPGVPGEDIGQMREHYLPGQVWRKIPKIAILDSGVDTSHPDLKDSIFRNELECPRYEQYLECLRENPDGRRTCETTFFVEDFDKNGYPLDCEGWSVLGATGRLLLDPSRPLSGFQGRPDHSDRIGHGTHVAGIVAASLNGRGIRGVFPDAKILPVQVIDEDPADSSGGAVVGGAAGPRPGALSGTVARGILYAIRAGADVINLSLGWNGRADSQLAREFFALAESRKILVAAAAGNDATQALVFPCAYAGVICVGAHGPDGKPTSFSNFGPGVDLYAPGLAILSTIPRNEPGKVFTEALGYDFKDGTSMATPFVSGALALLLAHGKSPEESRVALLSKSRNGKLDISKALQGSLRPYFQIEDKLTTPVLWDGKLGSLLESELILRNLGGEARLTHASWQLKNEEMLKLVLSVEAPKFQGSEAGRRWAFKWNARAQGADIPAEVEMLLKLSYTDLKGTPYSQTLRIPILISQRVGVNHLPPNAESFPLRGHALRQDANLRSIAGPSGHFLSLDRTPREVFFQWVEFRGNHFFAHPPVQRSLGEGEVLGDLKQAFELLGPQGSEIVLTFFVPPKPREMPSFRFERYGSNFNLLESMNFRNSTVFLPIDQVQWGLTPQNTVWPGWVGYGARPKEERRKPSPWQRANPLFEQDPEEDFYFYYLDPASSDQVRSIAPPQGWKWVTQLYQTDEERRRGAIPVLLSRSRDFVTSFSVAEVFEGRVSQPVPLKLDQYRNLQGLQMLETMATSPDSSEKGTTFYGMINARDYRVTTLLLRTGPSGILGVQVEDHLSTPEKSVDTLVSLAGAFSFPDQSVESFGQTYYDLSHTRTTAVEGLSRSYDSLRKYSFLPSQIFYFSFFPVVAEIGGQRTGGLLIPDGAGTFPGSEAVVFHPARGLFRPASFRFQSDGSCESQRRIDATKPSPSKMSFFCGDRFVRIPLSY
jgi:hypothetical protein